jgi:hypothetical protein
MFSLLFSLYIPTIIYVTVRKLKVIIKLMCCLSFSTNTIFITKGIHNARNYHSFYIFGHRVKKQSFTM